MSLSFHLQCLNTTSLSLNGQHPSTQEADPEAATPRILPGRVQQETLAGHPKAPSWPMGEL